MWVENRFRINKIFSILRILYNTYNHLLHLLLFFQLLGSLCLCVIEYDVKWKRRRVTQSQAGCLHMILWIWKKKERKRYGHDKNRLHDIITCNYFVLYNTYDERSSLFYCQNGSHVYVLVGVTGVTKEEGNNPSTMSSSSFSCRTVCWIGTIVISLLCVCICVYNMIYI